MTNDMSSRSNVSLTLKRKDCKMELMMYDETKNESVIEKMSCFNLFLGNNFCTYQREFKRSYSAIEIY